ncbi:uncharacterized protein [Ptychodera flava]|uniref:uncharacterized protein n=1 Tax=Ptychodera flava TaxID=63121 RepID=UPI00396A60C0
MWRIVVATLIIQVTIRSAHGIAPMVGVDCKDKLVTRDSMLGSWTKIGGSCCIKSIGILKDESLVGVGDDDQLYTKASPNVGDWEGPLPDTCCVKDVTVMEDGTLLGVNTDDKLVTRPWTRTTEQSAWTEVPQSKGVVAVDVYPDGRIFGVTKEGTLKVREDLDSKWKTYKTEGTNVKDIAIQRNGIMFGIGKKSKALHVLDKEGVWGKEIEKTDCVQSIASASNLDIYD